MFVSRFKFGRHWTACAANSLAYVGHLLQERGLHAPSAELVHPEGCLVLQRSTPRVKRVREIIVQKAADGGHVQVRKTAKSARKVSRIMACTEDAAKLGVEQVFGDNPVKNKNKNGG